MKERETKTEIKNTWNKLRQCRTEKKIPLNKTLINFGK